MKKPIVSGDLFRFAKEILKGKTLFFVQRIYKITMSSDKLLTKNFYKRIPKKDSGSKVQVSA